MNASWKRILSLFLFVSILFSLIPFSVVGTSAGNEEAEHIDCGMSELLVYNHTHTAKTTLSFSKERTTGKSYITDVHELAAILREAMVNRTEAVTVYYQLPVSEFDGTSEHFQKITDDILEHVLAHTGNPKEGDYIHWDFGRYSVNATIAGDGTYYYFDLNYSFEYYTTAAQQQELDIAIDALLDEFHFDASASDYDKVCAIYDYICDHIVYDYENLNDESYLLKYTAYAALMHKTSVCQGYATLLYRLLLESGVDCRVIAGISNEQRHAWNIVELDGVYYNLDSTWDAQKTTYRYFLKSDDNFPDHIRDEEYLTDEFANTYKMSTVDYDAQICGETKPHSWNSGVQTIAPACFKEGVMTYTCGACGATKTETIAMLEHNWGEWTYDSADAHVRACKNEGCTEQDEGDHAWGEWTCVDDDIHKMTCSVCSGSCEEKHKWNNGEVTKQPTATAVGEKTYQCEICEHTKTEELPLIGQVAIGDVNGDGKVNGRDRTTLARYLAKWDGYTEDTLNLAAADVNGDGKINGRDRTTLARHLAKWSGYETLPVTQ